MTLLLEHVDEGRWIGLLADDIAQWREREHRRPAVQALAAQAEAALAP